MNEKTASGSLVEAQCLNGLGAVEEQRGRPLKAEEHYRQALAITQDRVPASAAAAGSLYGLGLVAVDLGDVARAEDYSRQALAILQKLTPDSLEVAAILNNLGDVAEIRGDLDEAEQLQRQALAIQGKLAPGSLAVAGSLSRLGAIVADRGDEPGARKYYGQSLEIRQKIAPGSLAVADSLYGLGLSSRDFAACERYYQQALEIQNRLASGGLQAALSLNRLSGIAQFRGDLARAEEYERRALAILEKVAPTSLAMGQGLHQLGQIFEYRGDQAKAEQYHRQGLAIVEKLVPGEQVARSLSNLGNVAYERGDLAGAEAFHQRALAIREKSDRTGLNVALSLRRLGHVASARGDLAEAEDYQRRALAIREKAAPGSLEVANSLYDVGSVVRERGDLAKAESYFLRALALWRKIVPGSLYEAEGLRGLGSLAWARQDRDKAEQYFRRMQVIYSRLTPDGPGVASAFVYLCMIARDRGDLALADRHCHQALAIEQKLADHGWGLAEVLNHLGLVAEDRGDLDHAEDYFQQAVNIEKQLAPEGPVAAEILNSLGDVAFARHDLEKAEKFYRQALAIREKLGPGSMEHAETLAALATTMRRKGQPELAGQLFEQALDALQSQMARFGGSDEVRAGFRARRVNYFQDYIDLLIARNQPERAFQVLERSRARGSLENLIEARVDIRKGVDAQMLEQERSLRADIAAKSDRRIHLLIGDRHTEDEVAAINQQIDKLIARLQEVEGEIRASSPAYAALTMPEPLTARQVQQQLLDDNTLLLEFSLGVERSYVFVVTRESVTAYGLPGKAEIEAAVRPVYDLLTAPSHSRKGETDAQRMARLQAAEARYPQAANRLARMILGPVASLLGRKRLLIVPDGILGYVPFAALPALEGKSGFLIASHEIVELPSASVLQVLRQQSATRARAPKAVAVVADAVYNADDQRVRGAGRVARSHETSRAAARSSRSDLLRSAIEMGVVDGQMQFPRLIFARKEAKAILRQVPAGEGKQAFDFQASLATATSAELAQYRIIHFATHGILNSRHPELSGLVFSLVDRRGHPQNGFLTLTDIYNLNLPADLVVLSACETGLGKEIQGEGLVGITRGFMYAGASRVVASLWKVDDAATAALMRKFYQGMLRDGLQPAAALQRAQIEMSESKRWRSPYDWAGFVLQGEW